jgi:hypothetical protein
MNEAPSIFSVHGVRYQVTDVARAAAFYRVACTSRCFRRAVLRECRAARHHPKLECSSVLAVQISMTLEVTGDHL